MEIFFSPPFNIFTTVGIVISMLCIIEIVLFFVGGSMSKFFEQDVDLDIDHSHDIHIDHDLEVLAGQDIDIFHLGQVPFIVILLAFGSLFTLSGFSIHQIAYNLGISLSNLLVVPASIFASSLGTYFFTSVWKRFFPSEETYSINLDELLGQEGTVVLGQGDYNKKVQISVVDKFGSTHYMMTKCAVKDLSFKQGDKVTLIEKYSDGSFGAIPVLNYTNIKEINAS